MTSKELYVKVRLPRSWLVRNEQLKSGDDERPEKNRKSTFILTVLWFHRLMTFIAFVINQSIHDLY
jgi:hypothetical protein